MVIPVKLYDHSIGIKYQLPMAQRFVKMGIFIKSKNFNFAINYQIIY